MIPAQTILHVVGDRCCDCLNLPISQLTQINHVFLRDLDSARQDVRYDTRFHISNPVNCLSVASKFFNCRMRHVILIANLSRHTILELLLLSFPPHYGGNHLWRILILSSDVAYTDSFLCFVSFSNQIPARLLCDIPSGHLIDTYPRNRFISAIKLQVLYLIRQSMLNADVIAIVSVQNDVIPDHNCIPTAFA